ncbi:MAG: T9SS type A sorting domain-containing protein [Bacteroidetes bacterium]|nr:T9SS type A sorting domain-containing protein [Bacteroidota bacterium]MBU1115215.1 T9SS type A sorting domain-containing protein [Bacteroidota bacterium]MBU1797233.1 T9SS type A sorting domain-containing protein [Bacteroidota bacterium]
MFNCLLVRLIKKISLFILLATILLQFTSISAQSISVKGKITSSRFPIVDVLITFIDNADTTLQYSTLTDTQGSYQIDLVTSVKSTINNIPTNFELGQNYPNPFASSTDIPYGLNKQSSVKVIIYDILGRVVQKFNVGQKSSGTHNILWDGRNEFGQKVANGIYFYNFLVNGESQVKKMVFNQNGNSSFTIPRTVALHKNLSLAKGKIGKDIQGTNFTIRLQNSNTTTPLIVEQEINNIEVKNDTTINFSVSTMSVATINLDSLHQVIRGFGASNIVLWRPDMTESEVSKAFGTDDGQVGFSILRIMAEADSNRWSLYLPTAKKAQDLGATIIASPWFAPNRMSEKVGAISRVRYDMYAEYGEHLNSFNKYMKRNGVNIYGLSVQNEPDIEENWTSWTTEEMFTFMKDYAHAIEGTNVMAPESFHFDRTYSDPILNDSTACANTDIVCGHIYGGGLSQYSLAQEKGKEVWMTEYLTGEEHSANNWEWAFQVAKNINDVMKADMSAYVWWYIVRFYGPIADGESAQANPREAYGKKGEVTKKGYVMSQFSRFIRPGFYRIECSVAPTSSLVAVTSYKDPLSSKIVLVAINNSSSQVEQNFRIQGSGLSLTFIPYSTTENKNCEKGSEFNVTDGQFKFSLEPESITTFVSE